MEAPHPQQWRKHPFRVAGCGHSSLAEIFRRSIFFQISRMDACMTRACRCLKSRELLLCMKQLPGPPGGQSCSIKVGEPGNRRKVTGLA